MSNKTYERLWKEAESEVRNIVAADKVYVEEDLIEDRPRAYRQAASNYIRYSMVVNKLNLCLDQVTHVQKRACVRTLLEATLIRLLQVKEELVNQDCSDFNYLDETLLDMKLTPYDIEVQVPRYYRRERADKLQKIGVEIDRILDELSNPPTNEEDEDEEVEEESDEKKDIDKESYKKERKGNAETKELEKTPSVKKEEAAKRNWPYKKVEITESKIAAKNAILLIQRHERARKARLEKQELIEKKRIQHDIAWLIHKPIPEETLKWSVDLIQRWWRGCACRRGLKHRNTQSRLLLGQVTPSWRSHREEVRLQAVEEERHKKQKEADEQFEEAQERLQLSVKIREEDMMEDMGDFLRWWIEDWYRKVGELPAFPGRETLPLDTILHPLGLPKDTPEEWMKKVLTVFPLIPPPTLTLPGMKMAELGGADLLVADFWVWPEVYELAHIAARLAKGKKGQGAEKQKKEKLTKQQKKELKDQEKEKIRKEKEANMKELEEKLKKGVVPTPTDRIDPILRLLDKSYREWHKEDDLEWNHGQRHRDDLPRGEMFFDQYKELREAVDDLMRLELERLQEALDRDRGKKRKGGDKKKKKKKSKTKKAKKDLTADRSEESLFKELVEKGIIKKTEDVRIDSIFCQPSWNNCDLRRDPWWMDPPPNVWDVKQVLKDYCMLPLGSATVHRHAPLVRSVLLAGYPECGQHHLAAAVAAEVGAVVFDLTPSNTAGKYPGKKGLNMLVHLVTKMSRLMQPSVIFIDGGEKLFYKKVPKTEKEDSPKLLSKHLPKMIKAVTAEDQVLFLATSSNPLAGRAKAMAKAYHKILPVHSPDHSTAAAYWHHRLMQFHGVDRDFLYSPLAWCAQGYPLPAIDRVIEQVLTPRRIVALKYRPLDAQELLDALLKDPAVISEDQRRKLESWYQTTYPLAVKRAEKLKADIEQREKLAALQAKKNQKKKK